MHERFLKVFEKVNAEDDVKAAFSDAYVEKLTVSKSTKILQAEVSSKSLIPNRYKALMESAIFNTINAAEQVKINVKYEIDDKTPKGAFDFLWPDVVSVLSEESPVCGCVFEDCDIKNENGKIVIFTGHNAAFFLYKKGADKYITDRIKDEFGIDISIMFKNKKITEEEKQDLDKKHETYEKQLINAIISEHYTGRYFQS